MTELITQQYITSQIESYQPYDEQEKETKETFLESLRKHPDCFLRENESGHFSSSAVVLNKERTKILMIYHKIYDSWTWLGGHADADRDLLHVAIKEVQEESGLKNITPISKDVFAIDTLPVQEHIRKGLNIAPHNHFNTLYILEANQEDLLTVNEVETNGVQWVPIDKVLTITNEPMMIPVYSKVIEKMREQNIIH